MPTLTPAQTALLEKLRKGSFGGLTVKSFTDLCTVLAGWSIRPVVGYRGCMALTDALGRELGRHVFANPDAAVLRVGPQRNIISPEAQAALRDGRLVARAYDRATLERVEAWARTHLHETLPDAAAKGAPPHVVTRLGTVTEAPEQPGDALGGDFALPLTLLAKTKFYEITAPNGETFALVLDAKAVGHSNVRTFEHVLRWAEMHTDLLDQVNALLGTEPHVARRDQPRTEDHVATCGICGGQYKTKPEQDDALVKHGYERPGVGYLIGECFGTGHRPYELADTACRAFLVQLAAWRQDAVHHLEALRADTVPTLPWGKDRVGTPCMIAPDHPEWSRAREAAIGTAERLLANLDHDRDLMHARIEAWAPHPEQIQRPGQPATGLPAAVRWARGQR